MLALNRFAAFTAFGLAIGSLSILSAPVANAAFEFNGAHTTMELGTYIREGLWHGSATQSTINPTTQAFSTFAPGRSATAPGHTGSAGRSQAVQGHQLSLGNFVSGHFFTGASRYVPQNDPVNLAWNRSEGSGLNQSGGNNAPTGDPVEITSSGESNNAYATPIPPTIWLLASAMLGLLGFGSRRSRAA
jgi:hypothetical protein